MTRTARQTMDRATPEDALLTASTDALTYTGWRWTHTRRSDKALTMGHPGVPDIIAAKPGRVLFLELKSETGQLTSEQWAWLHACEPRSHRVMWMVVRPSDLDRVVEELR